MSKVRVRYAPSPTGLLHIGNARTALFNYIYAKHFGGKMILRIEDTDVGRNVSDGETSQKKYLQWLGINFDESPDNPGAYGPYRQLERLDLYKKYAQKLLKTGWAYEEQKPGSEQKALRFRVPKGRKYQWKDIVHGHVEFSSDEVEDWIMVKANGIPTYNFAVVIDDYLMEISHVLRGEEHISNTPKQLMVYEALGWKPPHFGHMTIIVNEQKKKLSKRDENVMQFISQYADNGYLPEAMFNFIALLGWSPKGNQEILKPEQIIKSFDPRRLSVSPAMFDQEKLTYINSKYIKKMPNEQLAGELAYYLKASDIKIKSQEWLQHVVTVFKDRLNTLQEISKYYNDFIGHTFSLDSAKMETLKALNVKSLIKAFRKGLVEHEFTKDVLAKLITETGQALAIKGKPLYMGLRIATTGEMHGPSLPELLVLLGKTAVIANIDQTLSILDEEPKL